MVSEFLNGEGIVRAAIGLGVATTTACSHLQQAFAKTGTDRQSELVELFFRGAAPFVRPSDVAASAPNLFSAAA